jgi:DNA-binding PadR family transcriptional regulator
MEAKGMAFLTRAQALKKEESTEERVYELLKFLDDNEGLSTYQISKELGWDHDLVIYYLSRLEKTDLVNVREETENNEIQKKIYVTRGSGIRDMLNLDEIDPRVLKEFSI